MKRYLLFAYSKDKPMINSIYLYFVKDFDNRTESDNELKDPYYNDMYWELLDTGREELDVVDYRNRNGRFSKLRSDEPI